MIRQSAKTNNTEEKGTAAVESLLQAIEFGIDHTIKSKIFYILDRQ